MWERGDIRKAARSKEVLQQVSDYEDTQMVRAIAAVGEEKDAAQPVVDGQGQRGEQSQPMELTGIGGDVKYSPRYDITAPFPKQVDDWLNGRTPKRDTLLLGRTPLVLRQVGLSDLPMTVDQRHLGYLLRGDEGKSNHVMPVEMVKKLPELLEAPIAVLESQTRPDDSVMVLVDAVINGEYVIAAVNIDSDGRVNGKKIDSNHMVSAQPRSNAVSKLLVDAAKNENDNKIAVYYLDEKRGVSILKRAGVQFPGWLNRGGLIHSIHDTRSPVNRKFMAQTDSVQFRRWFVRLLRSVKRRMQHSLWLRGKDKGVISLSRWS